jgi:crotonobetainyl-CoA:carnitine CoA-transferase CaiB-like acyl-CoA transferase
LSGTPADARGTAPRLGQHNAEVYADLLGIDSQELQRLKTLGAV